MKTTTKTMKTENQTVWETKIALINLGLEALQKNTCFKECLQIAGISHESTGFSPEILSPRDAVNALLKAKIANMNGLINHLKG